MFGHHMQMAAHSTNNTGFGTGGFGSHGHSAFDSSKKGSSSSFASGSTHLDPHGVLHQGYDEHGHYHHGILRQNSLLGEMTQSKKERESGVKPWAFASISYPTGQHGDGSVLGMSSAYHKPLEETHPRPKLTRQQSFSVGEGLERKRAPSFSSDPGRMRSRTISTASMPTKPLFRRSLSISEDITEPQNMDIAMPFLKRQQSLDIEKARKKSLTGGRKPLIPKFSKFRKSSKSKDPKAAESDTSSLHSPSYRSRLNSAESHRSRNSAKSTKEETEEQPKQPEIKESKKVDETDAQANLILGLLNPVTIQDEVFDSNLPETNLSEKRPVTLEATAIPVRSHSPIESPTVVSKRVHQLVANEQDTASLNSSKSEKSVNSVRSQYNSNSPIPQVTISVPMKQTHIDVTDSNNVESDTSEIYYDCDNQIPKPSSVNVIKVPSPLIRNKRRSNKRNADRSSSSTYTDGEDTTSTCDTPPRSTFRDFKPKYHPEYYHDAETLKLRGNDQPRLRNVKGNHVYVQPPHGQNYDKQSSNPDIIVPEYSTVLKTEPSYLKDNHNNETGTADSSESGYATSNIPPVSPKNYDHVKVSQFVNSLPNYPDMEEHRSGCIHDEILMNGSGTDNDSLGEPKRKYIDPENDFANINCTSGSDSENESVKSEISSSKLEVMKILDRSPTDVRQRVINTLNEKKNVKPNPTLEEDDIDYNGAPTTKLRKGSNASETEVMKLLKYEEKKDTTTEQPDKEKHVEVNTMVVNKEVHSDKPAETQLVKQTGNNHPSFATSVMERLSYSRQYSAYQSKSTKCVDALLHVLNVILFLSSAGVVTIGVWLQLKDFSVNDITVILGNNLLQVIIYVAISGASVTMLAAFCLCCGIRQDKVGLGFYASVLVGVVISFATAAVLSTIFSDKLRGVEFRFNFKDRLLTKYGLDELDIENKFFTDAWNDMQIEFECCGGYGNENDTDSWALYRMSEWFRNHENRGMVFVPESCCRKNSNIKVCQGGDHHLLGPPRYAPPRNKYYPDPNPNLNSNGCYTYLSQYLSTLSMYIAVGCGALAGLYFLTVMLTWVFCFKKSQDYSESFLDDSYFDIEDDAFNSEDGNVLVNREPDVHHKVEETKMSNTPETTQRNNSVITPACNGSLRNKSDVNRYRPNSNTDNYSDNNSLLNNARNVYNTREFSDDSDSESDSESGSSTSDVIERRNTWLSSGCTAGHLLSVAIEEEDSNFEDSDVDEPDYSAHV